MKKTLAILFALILTLALISGCASASQTAAEAGTASAAAAETQAAAVKPETPGETREPINLIFSHYQSPGTVGDNLINKWCQQITDASDGLITFEIYGGGSLGAAKDHYDMVRSGTCDIAYSFYGIHAGVFKSFETFSIPMIGFVNAEQASKAIWDFYENNDYAAKEMSSVHLLLAHSYSPCVLSTNGFKVEKAADLKGRSLRIMSGPINTFFTKLGATSMTVPISDIYENLQKGIMNGYVGGVDSILGYNLYENTTNILRTPIAAGPFYMWMNSNTWDKLPDWAKEIFSEYGGMTGAEFFGAGWDADDENTYAKIESEHSIIEINELSGEELANWQTVAGEITQDWITELNNAGYDGKTVVDTVKTLAEKYAP